MSGNKGLDYLLDDLPAARARRLELVQLACAGEAGEHVRGASVDNVPVARAHAAQLAGLQEVLLPQRSRRLVLLQQQALLTVSLRALPTATQAGLPPEQRHGGGREPALPLPQERGQGPAARLHVRGQDNRVGDGAHAVGHVHAIVLVVILFVFVFVLTLSGGGGGAFGLTTAAGCRDVRDGERVFEARASAVPVFPQRPAANAVPLQRRVELAALSTLPGVLGTDIDTQGHEYGHTHTHNK